MSPDKMIYQANQIATFFQSQPDIDKAGRVAAHLKDFWEPRMIAQFYRVVSGQETTTLTINPMVIAAAGKLQQMA
jgi:formate dehydrogenase subunit delta